jgi:hypothetical protein
MPELAPVTSAFWPRRSFCAGHEGMIGEGMSGEWVWVVMADARGEWLENQSPRCD